jgi:hypothetical protein
MSDLESRMRRQARAIASAATVPNADQLQVMSGAVRGKRRRRAMAISGLTVAGVALVAAAGYAVMPREDATPPVAPTVSSTPSPSVTPPPSATPLEPAIEPAIIEGFAPVPQLPASEIPWDQVGPGWFVVDYRYGYQEEFGFETWEATPQLEGGISLISPSGQWYAARPYAELGNGPVEGWDGINLWMTREATSNFESVEKRIELVDARSGDRRAVGGEATGQIVPFVPGQALFYAWGGDGLYNSGIAADKTHHVGGCSDVDETGFWGWEAADMSFLYTPANGGKLVCFGYGVGAGRASVTLVDVANAGRSEHINTFSNPADNYSFAGWIDADRFFFARTGGATPVMFRYDLRDDSVTEVDLPIYNSVDGWNHAGYFDRVSQRHVMSSITPSGTVIELFDLAGRKVATVSGSCSSEDQYSRVNVRTSGGSLLVACAQDGSVELFNLADGSQVGHWDVGKERTVNIFDAPDR